MDNSYVLQFKGFWTQSGFTCVKPPIFVQDLVRKLVTLVVARENGFSSEAYLSTRPRLIQCIIP